PAGHHLGDHRREPPRAARREPRGAEARDRRGPRAGARRGLVGAAAPARRRGLPLAPIRDRSPGRGPRAPARGAEHSAPPPGACGAGPGVTVLVSTTVDTFPSGCVTVTSRVKVCVAGSQVPVASRWVTPPFGPVIVVSLV